MKEQDPISWDMTKSEWLSFDEEDGNIITFDNGSTYFSVSEIEEYLSEFNI